MLPEPKQNQGVAGDRRAASSFWGQGLVLVLVSLCLLQCYEPKVGRPPAAGSSLSRGDVLPPHLDAALRLNLDKVRRVVEEDGWRSALALFCKALSDPALLSATEHARVATVGVRFAESETQMDSVVVLRGDFKEHQPDPGSWGTARLRGGGLRVYDRTEKPPRWAPARLYAEHEELLAFVSEAEIDALERRLAGLGAGKATELPERGALAFWVRLPALAARLQADAPRAAKLLRQGSVATGTFDLDEGGLRARASFDLDGQEVAVRLAEAARLLLDALGESGSRFGRLAALVRVTKLEASVVLDLSVPLDELRGLLKCTPGQGACLP